MLEDTIAQLLHCLGSSPSAPTRGMGHVEVKRDTREPASASKHSISFLIDSTPSSPNATDLERPKRKRTNATHPKQDADRPRQRPRKRTRCPPSNVVITSGAMSGPSVPPPMAALPPFPAPHILPAGSASTPSSSPPAVDSLFQHLPTAGVLPAVPSPFYLMAHPYFAPQLLSSIHQHLLAQPAQAYYHPHAVLRQGQQQEPAPLNCQQFHPPTSPVYLGPSTPPGHSSTASPPSSPVLLSSSPSSPLSSYSTTSSSYSSSSAAPQGRAQHRQSIPGPTSSGHSPAPNPPVNPNANGDVQQHTQQLLKQWHRQRQVQKLLYLQQKKHRQLQEQDAPVSRPPIAAIPPVPTFKSAAAGEPSSLPAETLMSLIDELLQRHVGSTPPRPAAANLHDKEHSKRRHRVPPEHLQVLEEVFAAEPFPHAEAKNVLAHRLGMTKRSITIWFQNKRARLKRNDDVSSSSSPSQSSGGPAGKSDGIVFHQLTVDTTGQLTIIPEFPLV